MSKYLTEFVGTFFLVLVIYLTVAQEIAFAPLVIGSVLMVMVYMGGAISGAHYNPAVTISLATLNKINWCDAGIYIFAQLLGAIVASLIGMTIVGTTFAPAPALGIEVVQALLVEIVFTFALVLVICNVAVSEKRSGNSYFGLAIGFTIFVAAAAGGGISGGAYNPAVGLGPNFVAAISAGQSLGHVWLYVVGPIVGGLLATIVYRIQEN